MKKSENSVQRLFYNEHYKGRGILSNQRPHQPLPGTTVSLSASNPRVLIYLEHLDFISMRIH